MTTMTATQRLAIGRLDALKANAIRTNTGWIWRQDIRDNEENAREVLRATWQRRDGA